MCSFSLTPGPAPGPVSQRLKAPVRWLGAPLNLPAPQQLHLTELVLGRDPTSGQTRRRWLDSAASEIRRRGNERQSWMLGKRLARLLFIFNFFYFPQLSWRPEE